MIRERSFPNVQSHGQLLPPEYLRRILGRDKRIPGMGDKDYHLAGERLNEAISRSWLKALARWRDFEIARQSLTVDETGASQTRETFLLPLFQELGYGRLSAARPWERRVERENGDAESFAISHFRDESPIHLVGCGVSLDRKTAGVAGAARQSPHSLVQEFLNRSPGHLWGFVSNGLVLRVLRDNANLSGQAYLEFDLAGIFAGESYSEFALLWLVAHHSRVHRDEEPPEKCWLELWSREAREMAVAALERLRDNAGRSIELLGQGFLNANPEFKAALLAGALDRQNFFRQLLRLIYRLVFLLVAEERGVLRSGQAGDCYDRYYSVSRLRDLAGQIRGSRHSDLWEGLRVAMNGVSRGCDLLGLAPMGGFLWSDEAAPDLLNLKLSNADLLAAVRALAFVDSGGARRPADWRDLGAVELGSVYEALLETRPAIHGGVFKLDRAPGNERKTTGSYYTPTELIESLLTTALDPVIERALRAPDPEAALLNLKICDPACGSGHFLQAAARRVAKRLARLRSGDPEPSATALRDALRDVVSRCVYGVDINPMSVELCKIGFWLETREPDKPLTFLDHHIVCANSLLGTTARAIRTGIPDDAYQGDKKAATRLRAANKKQRASAGQLNLMRFESDADAIIRAVIPDSRLNRAAKTLAETEAQEQAWRDLRESPEWRRKKFLYDLWTAAFVIPARFIDDGDARPFGITWNTLADFVSGGDLPADLLAAVEKAARDYQFFHCEVAFPEAAKQGGFDVVLGNPPWERIKLQEKEWFAAHNRDDIVEAGKAADRREKIAGLEKEDPALFAAWQEALNRTENFSRFLRDSGLYPLCGRGDINLYAVFAEWMRRGLNVKGRVGCVAPSGVATDDTNKFFFRDLIETQSLASIYDFENRKKIFKDIDSRIKFSLLTCGNGAAPLTDAPRFVFFAREVADLRDPAKNYSLSPADIKLLNPNTRTAPIFRTIKDAALTKAVYRRHPILIREATETEEEQNPWGMKFGTMFHMTNDSHLFRTRGELEYEGGELEGNVFKKGDQLFLPLYEAKMIHQYNHRWATWEDGAKELRLRDATLEELADRDFTVAPRYWVAAEEVKERLKELGWTRQWLMGFRDICRSTDERTIVGGVFPANAIGNNLPIWCSFIDKAYFLPALLSSFATDFFARLKIGGTHLNFFIAEQLPVLSPDVFDRPAPWSPDQTLAEWLKPRVLELTYTAEDLRPFAEDMGYHGDSFVWDEDRRARLRAELDAAFFHLYLPANADGSWAKAAGESEKDYAELTAAFPTPRDAVDYIMETFPIVKKNDEKKFDDYRTKRLILREYDEMAKATASGGGR